MPINIDVRLANTQDNATDDYPTDMRVTFTTFKPVLDIEHEIVTQEIPNWVRQFVAQRFSVPIQMGDPALWVMMAAELQALKEHMWFSDGSVDGKFRREGLMDIISMCFIALTQHDHDPAPVVTGDPADETVPGIPDGAEIPVPQGAQIIALSDEWKPASSDGIATHPADAAEARHLHRTMPGINEFDE